MFLARVGYSDNPDTETAGREAARDALAQNPVGRPCDLVLLFATSAHNPGLLRDAVLSVTGRETFVVGGGAIGAIVNDRFGYGGDQVGLAAFWFDGIHCSLAIADGTTDSEEAAGRLLGAKLAASGFKPELSALLFYDAIDRTSDELRLHLATPLLAGLEQALGQLPSGLVGAGLQGDYECSPSHLWTGVGISSHHALMLAFSGNLRIDSVILHGCRPTGDYYTVTKADKQTVLEIDGRPAIPFLEKHARLPAEEFPFFLILGVNHGDPAQPYDETKYANRLCLAVDRERNGVVMFESDLVAGTRFQLMYRSLDFEYIAPKIEGLFSGLGDHRPVFSFYINCAGRAARFAGEGREDAAVISETVAGRTPLLGIYSGVEIAPITGRPRTLDWTGVFCLFSVAGNASSGGAPVQ